MYTIQAGFKIFENDWQKISIYTCVCIYINESTYITNIYTALYLNNLTQCIHTHTHVYIYTFRLGRHTFCKPIRLGLHLARDKYRWPSNLQSLKIMF